MDKVSFIVSSNQPIALMGKSGVGKTTLFRIILGLETADVGTIQKEKQLKTSEVEKLKILLQKEKEDLINNKEKEIIKLQEEIAKLNTLMALNILIAISFFAV